MKASVLFDTGCTTDAVSPEFVRVAGLKPLELSQQVGLALAVKGSSSKLNYGTWAEVNVGPVKNANTYFDIINIDRYDVILGTPFLWKHSISLRDGIQATYPVFQNETLHLYTSNI